jgi:hypothetical protein
MNTKLLANYRLILCLSLNLLKLSRWLYLYNNFTTSNTKKRKQKSANDAARRSNSRALFPGLFDHFPCGKVFDDIRGRRKPNEDD